MAFFPRLSERGRLGWVIAAVVAAGGGVVVAVLRGDFAAAILMVLAISALVGVWFWGRGGREDDEDDGR